MESKEESRSASAAPVVDERRLRYQDALEQIRDGLFRYNMGDYESCAKNAARMALEHAYEVVPAAATAAPESKSCGFCGKSDQEVKALIQAPVGYICDECVAICASIIERAAPVEQQTPQTKLIDAVIYAVKEGCFFPVPEPKPGASVQELAQWGAMRNLHDAIAAFTREWKLREGAR